jgi:outer membrane protein TolC
MRHTLFKLAAYIQLGAVALTGCAPTQPYFLRERADLVHYLETAQEIEYPDLESDPLAEARDSYKPFSLRNLEYAEIVDLSLEECVQMALENSKILRTSSGNQQQINGQAALVLSGAEGQVSSVYDAAIAASQSGGQPLQIDGSGNRIAPRGTVRSNQVGGVEDALAEFDSQFSSAFGYNTTDRPRNVGPGNPFNPQSFQGVDSTLQFALSKRTAEGTIVTGRSNTNYSYNNIPTPGLGRELPTDYFTSMEVQVQHPLMRGRGALVNRIPVMLARINEDLALHEFEGRVRNLVRDVENAYWDLYTAYRAVEAARLGHESANALWRVAKSKLDVGEGAPELEAQSRSQVYLFQGQLERAFSGSNVAGNDPGGLLGRERDLRYLIGWAPTDNRLIRPIDEPTTARLAFGWDEVKEEGMLRSVELRQQKWQIKQRELELISAKNNLLPEVNVSGIYRWVGAGDVLAKSSGTGLEFPEAGSSAVESLLDGNYQEVGARLEFTPPAFGARRQFTALQNAKLGLVRSTAMLEEKEVALVKELSEAMSKLESHHVQAETFLGQWQASEREVSVWENKLEIDSERAEVVLDNLLRAQQRRADAQLSYYRAISEYNKSIAYVHYLKGSLLEYNNIMLEEGPWPHKAMWDALERARERAAATYYDYGVTRPGVISQGAAIQQMGNMGTGPAPKQTQAEEVAPDEATEDGTASPEAVDPNASGEELMPVTPESNEPATTERSNERSLLGSSLKSNVQPASSGRQLSDSPNSTNTFRPRDSKPIGSGIR